MKLNELAQICHTANKKWWQNIDTGEQLTRNKGELLMLMVSELSECMEGERKGLMDDNLPHRKMAEVECVDFIIRACGFVAGFGLKFDDFGKNDLRGQYAVVDGAHIGKSLVRYGEIKNRAEYLMDVVFHLSLASRDFKNPAENSYGVRNLGAAICMIVWYAEVFGYDLNGAFAEKMAFNATREDHTHEARKIAGGKQF